MTETNLDRITRKFIQFEGVVPEASLGSYLQSLYDTLSSFAPATQTDQRRLAVAFDQLRNIRRLVRKLEQRLQEQLAASKGE
jgi:hypothetical protein